MRPKFVGAVTWEALNVIARGEALEASEHNYDQETQSAIDSVIVDLLGLLTRLANEVRA